ncbi:fatty acid desaturase-domain-containing protein [Pelagophyceae sp. CCMP2097]|nr:fatty acid desaturase-domain-containing protein [Pelagophyceae sp. CCMP2097]|mmetsp:Transcript_6670/g.21564  ORF Transcript_6670/g.21564 Transcript_6670/m.21564 type:complete len:429 (-) Transcript_6670:203-1489(-)|eukprot:CAMPEP_0184092590 /NCGR_PEP_ID=MMETSP0974-20121125/8324_1 /TAXON_ID=483370 /ORGANISM="non described non described, Strain CCMP2097" /LENGTH=428 /DNA_ID=CAMNT_0026395349 /DNA_START=21 /DNA_END=1307 /DNA_ORIENTATION=-
MGKGGEAAPCVEAMAGTELSGSDYAAQKLSPEDAWIGKLDFEAFNEECTALGKELVAAQGPADVAHLEKIIWWSRLCQYSGALTMCFSVNIFSIFMLSLGTLTRWTIVGHHVCHGGFDKCDKTKKYNRFTFGVGSLKRRCVDWLDWMLVEAWNVEHNQLHHYHLGENSDPDLVEQNMDYLRGLDVPVAAKYAAVFWMMLTWKWWYYSPNTFKQLKANERRRQGLPPLADNEAPQTFDFLWLVGLGADTFFSGREFIVRVVGPYFLQRFVLMPLPALLFGASYYKTAVINLFLAELLTNAHSFLVVATNHAGDDLYRFEKHCRPRSATFFVRQIISSSNFSLGDDVTDFLHGWLNYQVEHHMWPDLSPLTYQKVQPRVEAMCKKHGIPYIKQSVWWRLKKLTDIMVGKTSMRKFPTNFEHKADLTDLNE